jgi:hypothetical protein
VLAHWAKHAKPEELYGLYLVLSSGDQQKIQEKVTGIWEFVLEEKEPEQGCP